MTSSLKFEFSLGVKPSDTVKNPTLIVGNIRLLRCVQYDDLKDKLQPHVTKEVCNVPLTIIAINKSIILLYVILHFQIFDLAVRSLHPSPSDSCSLYVNLISIAGFHDNVTHYNSTAQPHLLTKIIKSWSSGQNQTIVVSKTNIFYGM